MASSLLLALACTTSATVCATDDDDDGVHRVVIQVNSKDPALMNLALNNASNINKYYMDNGEEIKLLEGVEVVPSGVIHIIQRQEEGWSYLKP